MGWFEWMLKASLIAAQVIRLCWFLYEKRAWIISKAQEVARDCPVLTLLSSLLLVCVWDISIGVCCLVAVLTAGVRCGKFIGEKIHVSPTSWITRRRAPKTDKDGSNEILETILCLGGGAVSILVSLPFVPVLFADHLLPDPSAVGIQLPVGH